jgi:hypothetical protein
MHLLWAIIRMWATPSSLRRLEARDKPVHWFQNRYFQPPNILYFIVANSKISVSELERMRKRAAVGKSVVQKGISLYGDVKTVSVADVDKDIKSAPS